ENIFVQEGCEWLKEESLIRHIKIREHINAAKGKSIRQQNLFSSFTIQYGETKAKALAINFTHLNYNEITYHSPPCTLDPPHFYLEENNNFDSTNEENYTTY
ncbi:39742_t:CDS:2, partial [Gigaspora margarita]